LPLLAELIKENRRHLGGYFNRKILIEVRLDMLVYNETKKMLRMQVNDSAFGGLFNQSKKVKIFFHTHLARETRKDDPVEAVTIFLLDPQSNR
jgi:hypothetical protein